MTLSTSYPRHSFMVNQRVGGVPAGAFDETEQLVGFVFGVTGVRDGQRTHWSNMLAVRPSHRRKGVGQQLKAYQRTLLLTRGVEIAQCSFDPLRAGNAHFNLNVLGARPTEYVANMYGETGSLLHGGLETDRLIVEWQLRSTDVEARLRGARPALPRDAHNAPLRGQPSHMGIKPGRQQTPLLEDRWVRVAIPEDIDDLKSTAPEEAQRRQRAVRQAFESYLAQGYTRLAGFRRKTDTPNRGMRCRARASMTE